MSKNLPAKKKGMLRQSIVGRLAGGYALLILVVIAVAALGIINTKSVGSKYEHVLDISIPRLAQLQQIQADLAGMSLAARDALLSTESGARQKNLALIETGRTKIGERLEVLQNMLNQENTVQSKEVAQKISDHSSGILVGLVKFSRFVKAGKDDRALLILQESLQPKLEKLSSEIASYQNLQIDGLSVLKKEVAVQQTNEISQSIAVTLLAIILASFFAFIVVRSVLLPLKEATISAGYMAQGNFSHRLQAKNQDEVGRVVNAFNDICDGLSKLVFSIRASANQVNATAKNITSGNLSLENRAGEQTKALTFAMERIRNVQTVIDENIAIAKEAMQMATDMTTIVQKSSISVRDAMHEMAQIKQSSKEITDIIAMIDSIAFQTNILALNAAVEAARAGESGRGFAVVAGEVRRLAQRSAAASEDIKKLITASQIQVSNGAAKVQSITGVIENVMTTAYALNNLVKQISNGSDIQGQHMSEIVNSVSQIEAGNMDNLHLVGSMRFSSDELREMARTLNNKVAEFKTVEFTGAPA